MDANHVNIKWAGQDLSLLPDRALHWPARSTLIFSDVHLGKAHDFQAAGIPIPATVHDEDLERMRALLWRYRPERVFILGDFVHSHRTELDDLIAAFKNVIGQFKTRWILALGNHDVRAEEKLAAWGFTEIVADVREDGITFTHDPDPKDAYAIGGHVHPVVRFGKGADRMRLPCFVVNEKRILLPSFGSFTGGFEIKPKPKDQVFVAAHGAVISL